jgi:hypothetical protein
VSLSVLQKVFLAMSIFLSLSIIPSFDQRVEDLLGPEQTLAISLMADEQSSLMRLAAEANPVFQNGENRCKNGVKNSADNSEETCIPGFWPLSALLLCHHFALLLANQALFMPQSGTNSDRLPFSGGHQSRR